MENLNLFIDYIARTNLFNFVIFLSIIIFLIKKVNITATLEKEQIIIKDNIVASEKAKVDSEEKLSSIENSMCHIEEEIDSIIKKSEENATLIGTKILEDANKSYQAIFDNTEKALSNSYTLIKSDLLKKVSLASIEIAKKHIVDELSWNQGLHDKLIDESIEAIEGVN